MFQAHAENQANAKILILHSGNGGEFASREFAKWTQDTGIEHITCAPYASSMNSYVERVIKSIGTHASAMVWHSGVREDMWVLAQRHQFTSTIVFQIGLSQGKLRPMKCGTAQFPMLGIFASGVVGHGLLSQRKNEQNGNQNRQSPSSSDSMIQKISTNYRALKEVNWSKGEMWYFINTYWGIPHGTRYTKKGPRNYRPSCTT